MLCMSSGPVFSAASSTAPVTLTREGSVFRLAFAYHPDLVSEIRALPYATFDTDSKTWTCLVCTQAVDTLRSWFVAGRVDVNVDGLLAVGENIKPVAPAVLRRGSGKRPYVVVIGVKSDQTYAKLRSVVGASWDKRLGGLTYPPSSAAALADLVSRGSIADPDRVLSSGTGALVMFDARDGAFKVKTEDARAQAAFDESFPARDVVTAWQEKGLEVDFLDEFTRSMYAGELARAHPLDTPEGFKIDLFPHQRVNYSIAVAREGHAVFDEPGLGKSATAIAAGYTLLTQQKISRVIVVVPAAVRTQWAMEITRFTGQEDIAVVKGGPKSRNAAYEMAQTSRWLVVHYDVLTRDMASLRPLFAGAFVIADEAHRVKSREAARTKALRELSKACHSRLALTGTPVETSPEEWFEILSGWAMPGCLGSPYEFNERYRWKNRWGGYEGARNISELRQRSVPFYTRHTKSEVADFLPPLRVQHLALDAPTAYAAALRRAHADAVAEIRRSRVDRDSRSGELTLLDEGEDEKTGAEMTAVGLLRLLCSSPRIVAESDSASAKALLEAGLVPDEDGPKLDELRTMAAGLKAAQEVRKAKSSPEHQPTAAEVTGERMVVFTFSKRMANLISKRFKEDGIKHVLYTGDTSSQARDDAVAQFIDPTSDVIAFVSTDAGAEGLNLGRCCNLLVNFDLAWTASRMAQRAQRIHRLDGTAPRYLVVNLTVAGTIEAGILKLLESRADLTDALFGEEGGRLQATGRGRGGLSLVAEAFAAYAKDLPEEPAEAEEEDLSNFDDSQDQEPSENSQPETSEEEQGSPVQLSLLGGAFGNN